MRIPAPAMHAIRSASRTGWIDLEHDRHVSTEIIEMLGRERAMGFWRSLLKEQVETPLLRPLVKGAVRMLGLNPGSFVWALPKAWSQVYRHCAKPRIIERDAGRALLVLEQVAPEMLEGNYRIVFEAIFSGIYDLAGIDGEVSVREEDGAIVADFCW